MKINLLLLCLGMATTASAADVPLASAQPQPLAPAAGLKAATTKPATMHRVPSPSISETRVTRNADGSLTLNCVQRPNPKIGGLAAGAAQPQSVTPKQP
ncbi:MAG: hypothetical protein P4L92_15165 [Rudaea sp.]|nr:hypothetical protein [Rudaea sp.]